ncbi:hypothetical protein LUZ60_005725 [Juncus effusus]|nr:hypothetical protein LUZ60_005725 [Juncus effusus]
MRRSEWEDRCRRHPDHRLSKGVCPYCLRERLLTHLSASSSATNTTHASSDSTNNSVYSSNSNLSPGQVAASPPPQTVVSNQKESLNPNSDQALQKSRSLAFEIREAKEEERIGKKKKKKKKIERFFSRIIHGHGHGSDQKKKKNESSDLFHSKTMKEKSSTKWVLF